MNLPRRDGIRCATADHRAFTALLCAAEFGFRGPSRSTAELHAPAWTIID